MTVIVFKGRTMAADTAAFRGSLRTSTAVHKIIRTPHGALVGCSGDAMYGDVFRAWAMRGFPPQETPDPIPKGEDDDPQFGAIVALPDGRILEYYNEIKPTDCTAEGFVVEGAANEMCFTCHTLGMSAEEIVAHAIKHCVWAGGEVFAMSLDDEGGEVVGDDAQPEPVIFGEGGRAWTDPPQDPEIRKFLEERGL